MVKATILSNSTNSSSLKEDVASKDTLSKQTECGELILPISEQQKMDVDVEMKSVSTTPTKGQLLTLPPPSVPINISKTVCVEDNTSPLFARKIKNNIKLSKSVDTVIENMETSEQSSPGQNQIFSDVLTAKPQKTTNERIESMLSKVLNATWNEYCTGSMICPQTASFIEQHPEKRFDFESLITNVLMECVLRLYNDEETGEGSITNATAAADNIDADMKSEGATCAAATEEIKDSNKSESTPTYSTPKKIKSDDTEVQEIMANASDDQPSTSRGLQSGK